MQIMKDVSDSLTLIYCFFQQTAAQNKGTSTTKLSNNKKESKKKVFVYIKSLRLNKYFLIKPCILIKMSTPIKCTSL